MAVAIRLTRVGRKKSPHYRLVVADNRFPRDGRFIEIIGYYQPLKEEITLEVQEDRALYWLGVGALPSSTVRSLLQRKGIMKKWHEARVEARKALKAAKAEQPQA
ncbi:TPA: 30S ribosomal protein S16 [Candidatus Sumerlaeota bacterium]|jgi:small subunit ribosomal protein S16|nr:30S ribosomal protein S16 [Candidatus Sumerlaeota bacterium]